MVTTVICDIEGTTTPIDFVHKTLFPYSAKRLESFVKDNGNDNVVRDCLFEVMATVKAEEGQNIDKEAAVQVLSGWIEADRKHPALKRLQGMIWKEGYEKKAFVSEMYPDVLPAFEAWKAAGLRIGIYSSGSVQAQVLLFGHSTAGNLNAFLDFYFDTAVGGKREISSYQNISAKLSTEPASMLFLSDIEEELDAASEAGIAVVQIVRPGTRASLRHPSVAELTQVPFNPL